MDTPLAVRHAPAIVIMNTKQTVSRRAALKGLGTAGVAMAASVQQRPAPPEPHRRTHL